MSFRNYKEIKSAYREKNVWGLATSIDMANINPGKIRDDDYLKKYLNELCELISMKQFGSPVVIRFDPGFTMMQMIETSMISGHFDNEHNRGYIDIFSCKIYDPFKAADFTSNFFGSNELSININLRI